MGAKETMIGREYPLGRNLLYCLRNTAGCDPALLAWCALLIALGVALPVLQTYLPKLAIERLAAGSPAGLLGVVLGFSLAIALLAALKQYAEKYVFFRKYRMNTFYARRIAAKGLTTDYRNQEEARFRKLQNESRAACDGNYSPLTQVYDAGVAFVAAALGFAVYFVLLARLSAYLALFLAAFTLAGCLLNKRSIRWAAKHNEEKIGHQQRMDYLSRVAGETRAAKDIRLYRMPAWFSRLYGENLRGIALWYRRYAARVFGVTAGECALSLLREGALCAYLLWRAWRGALGAADFALYFGLATGFSLWLEGLLAQLRALDRVNLAVNTLRAYLDYPETYRRAGGAPTDDLRAEPRLLEMRNVSYRYEGAAECALRDIDLRLAPGEHLAVVGLNGAGKTTLVKLLCGLIDPSAGQVLYDGRDVRDYDREAYYRLFSAVFQQFSLLPVEIMRVVTEDAPDAEISRVAECLKQAGLWERAAQLPLGLQTPYGKAIHDGGVELSGGETQKLLLARALFKAAPMLLLDEPTAALDPIAESRLYERYGEIMRGRSTVFVSHRLASTRFCDRILLIEDGTIREEGTHEELLARRGRYYELFEAQAKYYREEERA